ncbi:MAG: hypothetical protein WDO56_29295 [Gammaproteobacteria bacterium]
MMLPDGRIVAVTRYQEFYGPHELGDTATESDYWLEFNHPDTNERVRWTSNRDLATVALMIDKDTPELLVTPWFGSSIYKYNCPDPLYLLFRYESRRWTQIDLSTLRGLKIRPNITISPSSERVSIESNHHHLSWRLVGGPVGGNPEKRDIDFRALGTQTFGKHCDPPFNLLVEKKQGESR